MQVRGEVRSCLQLILCLTLILSIAGCGGGSSPTPLVSQPPPSGGGSNQPSPPPSGGTGASAAPQFAIAGGNRNISLNVDTPLMFSYRVNPGSGGLEQVTGSPFRVPSGNIPVSTVVLPSGKFAFVVTHRARNTPPTLEGFAIDQTTGALAPITGSPSSLGFDSNVYSVNVHPSGGFLYLAGIRGIHVFSVDQSTGAFTQLPGSPYSMDESGGTSTATAFETAVVSPKGDLLFAIDGQNRVWVFQINPASGSLTRLQSYAAGSAPSYPTPRPYFTGSCDCIHVHPSGRYVYVANGGSDNVSGFVISTDGTLTPTPGSPYPTGSLPASLEVTPSGNFLYVSNFSSNTIGTYRVETSTGTLIPAGVTFTGVRPSWLEVERDGKSVYVVSNVFDSNSRATSLIHGYQIDGATGTLSPIPGSPFPTDSNGGYAATISTPKR